MKNVRIAFPFLVEADHLVALICTEREAPLEDLGGTTFSLLECGAVVTKESTLGKDTQRMRPAQVAVMRFFEGSGLWGPGDGTLVSEYYFNRLSY